MVHLFTTFKKVFPQKEIFITKLKQKNDLCLNISHIRTNPWNKKKISEEFLRAWILYSDVQQ